MSNSQYSSNIGLANLFKQAGNDAILIETANGTHKLSRDSIHGRGQLITDSGLRLSPEAILGHSFVNPDSKAESSSDQDYIDAYFPLSEKASKPKDPSVESREYQQGRRSANQYQSDR